MVAKACLKCACNLNNYNMHVMYTHAGMTISADVLYSTKILTTNIYCNYKMNTRNYFWKLLNQENIILLSKERAVCVA